MATLVVSILITSSLGLLLLLFVKYLQQLRFIRQFTTPGLPLPIIGHAHLVLNVSPEDIVNVLFLICGLDKERRTIAGILGHKRMILVFHPEAAEPILNSSAHTSKSMDYNVLLPWLGTGLLISRGEKWRQRRKMLTPAFHFKILEDSMRIFNENAATLGRLLLKDGQNGDKVLDLFPYLTRCTLDIILESAMGKSLDIQNNGECDYAQCTSDMLHLMQFRQKSPWLWPDWTYSLTSAKKKQDKYLKVLHGFTKRVIQEKKRDLAEGNEEVGTGKKRLAFLDLLLTVKTSDGLGLSDQDLQEEVDTFMFEGHDTTACALSWTLLLLANHPEVQDKILEEQREIFGDDSDADVEQEQLTKMKYLECCVKEALRLYPSVPLFGRTIEEDTQIDGKFVPRGTTVIITTMMMHRNEKIWKDPNEFRPERFLAGGSEETERHAYAYIPFSAGPRNCIGQRFAMMEEKTVLSRLLRKVEVVKGDSVEDVKPVIEIITRPKEGIRAFFRERSRM